MAASAEVDQRHRAAIIRILELVIDANHPTRAFDEARRAEIKRICEEALKPPDECIGQHDG